MINKQNVELVMTAGLPRQFPVDGLNQVAFSGRSNVGKSSLINSLLGKKRLAHVSSAPGKTITVNFYCVDKSFYLVDLPGYGYAKRSAAEQEKWSALTDGYLQDNAHLKAVVQLVDLKVGLTKDDIMMLDYMTETNTPYLIVATKADKLNTTNRTANLEALHRHPSVAADARIIPFSALKGTGRDEVWDAILQIQGEETV